MKVTNTKGIQGVSKSNKSSKSGKSSGVSFDALVEAAGAVEAAEATEAVGSVIDEGSNSSVPTGAEERGNYMLEQLEDLEKDILSGDDTGAVKRLQEALDSDAVDVENLDPELKEILDEIEARASIEIAKMQSE